MKFHGWKRREGKRVVGGARPVPVRPVGSPLVVGPAVRPSRSPFGPLARRTRRVIRRVAPSGVFKKGRV